ncbi:rhodanese-like domain-containing protein [Chitinilyticum piscinae]|uniref:Rhodanese-like domain-containing protein n=1 Tax=Chitinilyticum piscinae TaxID=2866724 RepID=A0A8J7K1B1_9NEIS|nr:rhodanese-like domain-containing protein [Chitinilyticum piscinae]MBE9608981.1 rhodanese-like domain-containing protein [Chitinilyticum piscinae]
MSELNQIFQRAQARAGEAGLPYSGAVTPAEAFALLQGLPNVRIVDVRSSAEWQWVGVVPGAELVAWREWDPLHGMQPNPHFLQQLQTRVDRENVVLFLCRSGARSHDAAALAAQHGYSEAYNILEGFEGDKDGAQHRGALNGWQAAGLPWQQG